MCTWRELENELDHWLGTELKATFWWRDDDLVTHTSALDRVLALADKHEIPLALAVIPRDVDATHLAGIKKCTILQHGFSHASFTTPPERKSEFPPERQFSDVRADLLRGKERLEDLFGESFHPILVPPWNRMASPFVEQLPSLGFCGISRFGPRSRPSWPGLVEINTHIDPVDWRGTRGLIALDRLLGMVETHLRERRTGVVDPTEPSGLLTHHLMEGEEMWTTTRELIAFLAAHAAVEWVSPRQAQEGLS